MSLSTTAKTALASKNVPLNICNKKVVAKELKRHAPSCQLSDGIL
jgi:hypothetical protein